MPQQSKPVIPLHQVLENLVNHRKPQCNAASDKKPIHVKERGISVVWSMVKGEEDSQLYKLIERIHKEKWELGIQPRSHQENRYTELQDPRQQLDHVESRQRVKHGRAESA